MRTNIVLNDDLIRKGLKLAKVKTKKDLIDRALQEFVDNHSILDIADLRGKIKFQDEYDYKKLRKDPIK